MSIKNLSIGLVALLIASCSSNISKNSAKNEVVKNSQEIDAAKSNSVSTKEEGQVVLFDKNSFALSSDALKILNEQILPMIKESKNSKIMIEGHCDERGSVSYNKKLGKLRADAVKTFLVKNGVKSAKVKVVSYGKSKPVALGHDEESWVKNRRAVTIFVKK